MKTFVVLAAIPALVMTSLIGLTMAVTAAPDDAISGATHPCPTTDQDEATPITRLYDDQIGCGQVPYVAAMPFAGPDVLIDDPTSSGRITTRTRHLLAEVERAFGPWRCGVHCWDPHPWNPSSDHPRGRACDYTVGRLGTFPDDADRATGWALAHWLQTNAAALGISYLIWDGHIWSPTRAAEGWRPYTGAGIYDVSTPTGGHYDHIHVSVIP